MAAILDEECSLDDIRRCEKQYKLELAKGMVDKNIQFQYAWCLVRTRSRHNLETASNLLHDLFRKAKDEQEKRDYLFYMIMASTKLKDYENALKYADGILKVQPNNHQVRELREEITRRMKKDGLIGIAVAGGAAAVAVAGLATIIGLAVSRR